jgi:hypothetical protein
MMALLLQKVTAPFKDLVIETPGPGDATDKAFFSAPRYGVICCE